MVQARLVGQELCLPLGRWSPLRGATGRREPVHFGGNWRDGGRPEAVTGDDGWGSRVGAIGASVVARFETTRADD